MIQIINEKRKKILRKKILADILKLNPKNILDNGAGKFGSWDYEKTPKIKITKTDIIYGQDSQKLPFKNNSFDCIVFAGVIQYLDNPLKSLEECNRLLKKQGYLIFSTINANSLINSIVGFKAETITFTQEGVNRILKEHGFKVLETSFIDFSFIPKKRKMILYALCKKE